MMSKDTLSCFQLKRTKGRRLFCISCKHQSLPPKSDNTATHTHTISVTDGQQPRQQAAIKEAGLH